MKKFGMVLAAGVCVFALTACGENEGTEEETAGSDPAEEETEGTEMDAESGEEDAAAAGEEEPAAEEMSAEDILTKSHEAMAEVNSFHSTMNIEQMMDMNGEEMPMDMTISMDTVLEPMSFYQVLNMPDPSTGEEIEFEQYLTEDGMTYMSDHTDDEWLKAEGDEMGTLEMANMDMTPQEQVEMLQDFTDEITVEEEDGRYAVKVEGSGEELMEIAEEFAMMESNPQMEGQMEQVMEAMEIKNFHYVLYINQETFYQEEVDMNMEMEIQEEDQTMSISQSIQATFSEFDEIGEIEVPQEIVDNAVDMEDVQADMEKMMEEESMEESTP
ncbi:DUF6612 family protein [Alteribacillus sp. HJP-4]|uniref:DUF6612 family protein n=1 Tax=Alteribacillus sp. HJP-4 TaxID=2775394 RepID=UPI0035CCCEBE